MRRKEILARACHSAWYVYTVLGLGEEGEPWDTAPEWQKASILDAVGFWDRQMVELVSDPYMYEEHLLVWARKNLPLRSHRNWMNRKCADGWTYGETKDAKTKTHPCMVPYDDLPEADKIKDLVVVEAYLALRSLPEQPEPVSAPDDPVVRDNDDGPPSPSEIVRAMAECPSVEEMKWTRRGGCWISVAARFSVPHRLHGLA